MSPFSLTRRDSLALVAAAGLSAGAAALPAAGQQFTRLATPLPKNASGKIEVVEFFMYSCPHCNAFEPLVQAWKRSLPAQVEFRAHHIGGRAVVNLHQRLFMTLQAMGVEAQFRAAVFAALHVQQKTLQSPEEMVQLLQPLGLDVAKFNSTWAAFDPKAFSGARIAQANKLAVAYGIDQVPLIGVGGLYVTGPGMPGMPRDHGQSALGVVDYLIQNYGKV